MLDSGFLKAFKQATEANWRVKSIDPAMYGFQFQQGTRWRPGLSNEGIEEFETSLGVLFPVDFKAFLREMNGTDLPTLNVYGSCGEPHRYSVGVYSYPRDAEAVKQRIKDIDTSRTEIASDLAAQGFELLPEANLVPVFAHRYIVCSSNLDSSVVLSIIAHATDAIVYANSLREYLEKEFLESARS